MSVRLVIESSPHAQAVTERVFTGGRLVIGRSDDADWSLNDPDMYVSRQHCILTEQNGQVMATDASSSGLFIDNAAHPVGASKSVPIEPGMRLRMGDFVLRVEALTGTAPAPRAPESSGMVFDFSRREDEPPAAEPVPRPKDLPDPFGLSSKARSHERARPAAPPKPLDQEDAFGLDLRSAFEQPATPAPLRPEPRQNTGDYFDSPSPTPSVPPNTPVEAPAPMPARKPDIFADWDGAPADLPPDLPHTSVAPQLEPAPMPEPEASRPRPVAAPAQEPVPHFRQQQAATPSGIGQDPYEALLRGMGLDPAQFGGDPVQQAEQIGRSMRILVEGLMQQLRTRAMAKQKARVAQTIVASSDVNPLKFLATPDDVLTSLVQPRSRGYLGAEDALNEAFRDLTDHQLRTWAALQTALRRMIDRFDPAEIEKAMADVGLLESLIAGGRSAKLWRLYEERYREIARSAEDQFLGEVGADFREAYESGRS
ncbi:type VI secretion system-associated FHA domain protein TagH [Paracoccus marinaquae]|uniref:Type VI secretion system-associated FHA domain protein TagH n=1 Tax=Paracoccus marinaquae TaxID=2841926 RepID=A0ABS6ALM4_9RHOB|nr:type VI secretion system-associated FHA domain protein TagH [Paracoccus marinaquae]MBU3031505.1 type VI secretion system-associated FHA domain protein TagH [Paracoccus marinaquae]